MTTNQEIHFLKDLLQVEALRTYNARLRLEDLKKGDK